MTKIFLLGLLINLIILGCAQGKKYKGAEYRTKEAFIYGRFETRYKPANREAVVSSFFTYHDITDSSAWNEIDFEFIGRYANNIQFNVINKGYHIRNHFLEFNPYIDFHTYAFEWTPDYVAWFVDGEEVYRQTGIHDTTLIHPQKIMMNIWNPVFTGWVGYWNEAYLPAYSQYDWIAYHSYTPGTGNSGTDNNFTSEWKDDLDSFDEDRWQKATHTFNGNQCDFIPENIIFEDGIMTLALTSEDHTGGADVSPPVYMWARENYDKTVTVMFSEELDKTSAETISNYILPGVTLTEAVLSEDKKSVTLFSDNYDLANPYNLIVMNVTDDADSPNKIELTNKVIIKIDPIEFPFAVNIGGDAYENYMPDQEWGEDVEYGYWMGDVRNYSPRDIGNTDDDEVFLSERKGLITYKIRVPDGTYNVSLQFSENAGNMPGDKLFDIVVENKTMADDLDISALAGSNTAYFLEKEVLVEDEVIDIYFSAQTDSAFINAIKIDQLTTGMGSMQNSLPQDFIIHQNYPNPFNPTTTIKYEIGAVNNIQRTSQQHIKLNVYNTLGQKVAALVNEEQRPGNYEVKFSANGGSVSGGDAADLPSGIYFCTLQVGDKISSIKMTLIK